MRRKILLVMFTLLPGIGICQPAQADLLTTFSGPNDLNLQGNFLYAIDIPGTGGVVNGVTFTDENVAGVSASSNFAGVTWATKPEYGNDADSNSLESIMHGVRAGLNGGDIQIELAVNSNVDYRLQLLWSENFWNSAGSRSFDVLIEGVEVLTDLDVLAVSGGWTGSPDQGVVYISDPVSAADGTLNIQIAPGSGVVSDFNPILNALTLQAIPEPSSATILSLFLAGLFMRRQKRSRSQARL